MPFGCSLPVQTAPLKPILLNQLPVRQTRLSGGMILDTESNKSERGFILISVAIALSIAVIVLTITLSSHFRGVETSREYESIQEMNRLKDAITGTSIENFGFIGDMGRLPNSLSELNTQGTQTAFHTTDGTTPHF